MISADEMQAVESLAEAAERGELAHGQGTSVGGAELRSYLEAVRATYGDDIEALLAALFAGPSGEG